MDAYDESGSAHLVADMFLATARFIQVDECAGV
jgi:hypothetical protein